MPKRIIGQCHNADFYHLAHLSGLMEKGEEVYLDNLTKKEKVAVRVIDHFLKHDVPLKLLLKIKEVLVWDMGDDTAGFEFKLMDPTDMKTARLLRSYR